jgi:hypothetical protein
MTISVVHVVAAGNDVVMDYVLLEAGPPTAFDQLRSR